MDSMSTRRFSVFRIRHIIALALLIFFAVSLLLLPKSHLRARNLMDVEQDFLRPGHRLIGVDLPHAELATAVKAQDQVVVVEQEADPVQEYEPELNNQLKPDHDVEQETSGTTHGVEQEAAEITHSVTEVTLPTAYVEVEDALKREQEECLERYGSNYLSSFAKAATQYCTPESASNLTCFSHKSHDTRTDSFCIGAPATFDASSDNPFGLSCEVQKPEQGEPLALRPSLNQFPSYWYETGPSALFRRYIDLDTELAKNRSQTSGFTFLIRREGTHKNMWHSLMEMMSLTLSIDVLRMTTNPETRAPYFTEQDVSRSQVIILDEYDDGPFFDLWSMFAKLPVIRLTDVRSTDLTASNIVIPLPGGSNPFWNGDWADLPCGHSTLLHTFSERVLDFYNITPSPPRAADAPLRLTMIDRKKSRHLQSMETHFSALQTEFPSVEMQLIDFANLTFAEQLHITQNTDILVGVHGAGLTHGMFLPSHSAIIEIQPPALNHKGFGNMARFLGHSYFEFHSNEREDAANREDWHFDDVYVPEERFIDFISEALIRVGANHR